MITSTILGLLIPFIGISTKTSAIKVSPSFIFLVYQKQYILLIHQLLVSFYQEHPYTILFTIIIYIIFIFTF